MDLSKLSKGWLSDSNTKQPTRLLKAHFQVTPEMDD